MESKVFDKWAAVTAVVDRFAAAARRDFFRILKYRVAEKINTACGSNGTLASYDAEIYDSYMRILSAYREVASIYLGNGQPIASPSVKEIWEGICEVLMSRLSVISEKDNFDNPVEAEKKEIVSRAILAAMEQVDAIIKNVQVTNVGRGLIVDSSPENVQIVCAEIAADLRARCISDLYGTYISAVRLALTNLNDLFGRQDVSYYNELLKEEHEILRQMVVVQAAALEEAARDGAAMGDEVNLLDGALNVLREAYQKESSEISRIERLFCEAAARNRENKGQIVMDVETEEDFAASLMDIAPVFSEKFNQNLAKAYVAFINLAEDLAGMRLDAYSRDLAAQRADDCKSAVAELANMSKEINLCFSGILDYYDEHAATLVDCDASDIIRGVAETISIKIESLNEAIEALEVDAQDTLESFVEIECRLDAACFEKHIVDGLMPYGKDERKGAKIVKVLVDSAISGDYRDKIERGLARKSSGTEKKLLAFKRDSLLFELSTFEEIMLYSVSRLRESASFCVLNYVAEIDKQFDKAGDILTKYGIEKIVPMAHEPFNSRENEVLMVEENDNFKKGEIIKTVNSGYRQGDMVIMRANVIAAK